MVIAEKFQRPSALMIALLLLAAMVLPLLTRTKASAYALVTAREIKMSSSAVSATGVTYRVTYTAATSHTVKGIVVDFCAGSSSPIIGDTCTAPTGFSVGTPTVSLVSGISGGTWASGAASANSGRTLVLTDSTGNSMTAGSTTVSFDITTVSNPTSSAGTFYARILTYSNASGGNDPSVYTATANGTDTTGVIDAGGVALSTSATITVTSKVQERLTFCVYTGAVNTSNCTVSGSTVTLGDTNGVLSDAGPFVDKTAKYNVSTNASNGVTIRAKGATLKTTPGCSNSTGQTCSIDPINSGGSTAASSSAGSEQFGFCTYREATSASGLSPVAPYDNANCSSTTQTAGTASTGGVGTAQFGFDTTTGGDNITTTFGDTIATKTAGSLSTGWLAFVGNVASATEPGIYTATLTFIATGNY